MYLYTSKYVFIRMLRVDAGYDRGRTFWPIYLWLTIGMAIIYSILLN